MQITFTERIKTDLFNLFLSHLLQITNINFNIQQIENYFFKKEASKINVHMAFICSSMECSNCNGELHFFMKSFFFTKSILCWNHRKLWIFQTYFSSYTLLLNCHPLSNGIVRCSIVCTNLAIKINDSEYTQHRYNATSKRFYFHSEMNSNKNKSWLLQHRKKNSLSN